MEIKSKHGKYLNPTESSQGEKKKEAKKKMANNAPTHTKKEISPGMSVIK